MMGMTMKLCWRTYERLPEKGSPIFPLRDVYKRQLKETPEDVVRDIGKKHVIIGTFVSKPAGSIRFDILPGNIAYISRFGVRPEFQKYGMGKALSQFVHARCRELGLNAIVLHTGAKVFQLVRCYYGMGYYVHSTTTDRVYIRAFLVHELQPEYDLSAAMEKYTAKNSR